MSAELHHTARYCRTPGGERERAGGGGGRGGGGGGRVVKLEGGR